MRVKKLHKDIHSVIDAIQIQSPSSYSLNGLKRDLSGIKLKQENGEIIDSQSYSENQFFEEIIKTDIYNRLYKFNALEQDMYDQNYDANEFLNKLSSANSSLGTWEDNWTIFGQEIGTEKIVVAKSNIKYWVPKDEVISCNGTYERDTPCLVKIGKELKNLNASFYMVFGNVNKEKVKNYEGQLIRFYWNLSPKGAIKYIELITKKLNDAQCFFKTKVLSNPLGYDRSDSGVLYIDKGQLEESLPLIVAVYRELIPFMKNSTPLFTRKLGRGFSFAEDPQDGNSFGISRSQIIGNTLFNCFKNKKESSEEVKSEMYAAFNSKGISPDHPYTSINRLTFYENIFANLKLN